MYFMLRLVGGRLYVGSHCAIEWNTLEKKDSDIEEGYTGYVCWTHTMAG